MYKRQLSLIFTFWHSISIHAEVRLGKLTPASAAEGRLAGPCYVSEIRLTIHTTKARAAAAISGSITLSELHGFFSFFASSVAL